MRDFVFAAVIIVGSVFGSRCMTADEWPRFRGPNGTGVNDDADIPAQWTPSVYNWRVALPGGGHGSPVVWGERLFLISADPDDATRFVLCLDARNGKTLWTKRYPSTPHHLHKFNSFASPTPAVDAEHVYVAWSTPEAVTLLALNHEGDEVWRRDLGPFVSMHGFGTSPTLYEDLVFLWYDKGIVTCIEGPSGDIVWRERVRGNYFSSPVRVRDRIFCMSDDGDMVVIAAGRKFQLLARNRLVGEPSRATPAVAGGRMYVRLFSHLISVGGS